MMITAFTVSIEARPRAVSSRLAGVKLLSAVLTDTSDILLSDVDVFADEQPVNKDTADKKLTAVINVFCLNIKIEPSIPHFSLVKNGYPPDTALSNSLREQLPATKKAVGCVPIKTVRKVIIMEYRQEKMSPKTKNKCRHILFK